MFVYDKDVENLFRKCNVQLQNLYEWFLSNKLSLNSEKCIYSVFGKESNTINDTYAVIINNKILKREKSVKYLGILIDEKLLWEEHIQYVTNKLIKYSSIFYKLRAIGPPPSFENSVFCSGPSAFVVWGGTIWECASKISRPTH